MATERMKAGSLHILHKLEQARGDSNPNQVTSRKKIKVMHRSKRKCSDNIWKQIEKVRNSNIARAQLIKY